MSNNTDQIVGRYQQLLADEQLRRVLADVALEEANAKIERLEDELRTVRHAAVVKQEEEGEPFIVDDLPEPPSEV